MADLSGKERFARMLTKLRSSGETSDIVIAPARKAQVKSPRVERTVPPLQVGHALKRILSKQHGVTCTGCFDGTLRQLNAMSVEDVRTQAAVYAVEIWSNAQVARDTKHQAWAKTMLDAHPRPSDSYYVDLVLAACDACTNTTSPTEAEPVVTEPPRRAE